MTDQQMRDAVLGYLVPIWNTATSSAALFFDNPFTGQEPPTDGSTWGRIHIREQTGTRASLGGASAKFRRTGTIYIQIFTRVGEGTTTIGPIAEAMRTAFEDAGPSDAAGVWFRDPVSKPVGQNDRTYYQWNVEASFTYDRNS